MDVVEELYGEVNDFFVGVRALLPTYGVRYSEIVMALHDMYSKEIIEIIEKYRR